MPSTFSPSLRLELIGTGEQSGVWGVTTNSNLGTLVEQALTGNTSLNVTSGNITLTALNGVVDQSRSAVLFVTGTPGTTRILTIPNVTKSYTVKNTSDSTVQVKTSGGSPFNIPSLSEAYIYCNGVNVITGRVITDGANTILSQALPFNSPAFTGVPTAPTAAVTTNNTQIATTAFVRSIIPAGVIMMWGGSIASIPAGWALCDGTGGTPDLRDRFIVGAGTSYAVGDTGGANSVTLSEAQMPSHTHSGTTNNTDVAHTHTFTSGGQSADHTHTGVTAVVDINHTHSGTTASENQNHTHSGTTGGNNVDHAHYFVTNANGAHQHSYVRTVRGSGFDVEDGNSFTLPETGAFTSENGNHQHDGWTGGQNTSHVHGFSTGGISNNHQHAFTSGAMNSNNTHSHSFTTGGVSANHTHSGTTDATSITHSHTFSTNATGGGQAHENRPPYYALAYIMKT